MNFTGCRGSDAFIAAAGETGIAAKGALSIDADAGAILVRIIGANLTLDAAEARVG